MRPAKTEFWWGNPTPGAASRPTGPAASGSPPQQESRRKAPLDRLPVRERRVRPQPADHGARAAAAPCLSRATESAGIRQSLREVAPPRKKHLSAFPRPAGRNAGVRSCSQGKRGGPASAWPGRNGTALFPAKEKGRPKWPSLPGLGPGPAGPLAGGQMPKACLPAQWIRKHPRPSVGRSRSSPIGSAASRFSSVARLVWLRGVFWPRTGFARERESNKGRRGRDAGLMELAAG